MIDVKNVISKMIETKHKASYELIEENDLVELASSALYIWQIKGTGYYYFQDGDEYFTQILNEEPRGTEEYIVGCLFQYALENDMISDLVKEFLASNGAGKIKAVVARFVEDVFNMPEGNHYEVHVDFQSKGMTTHDVTIELYGDFQVDKILNKYRVIGVSRRGDAVFVRIIVEH